jgi:hypothetical protein
LTWLSLTEATVLIDRDGHKVRERLERAISKAWQTRGVPEPALDPNVPLRIIVTPPPGLQIEGRGWLHNPVLDWEASEIECLCKPRLPPRLQESSPPATQCRAKIAVWKDDLVRLWAGNVPKQLRQREVGETASALPQPSQTDACDEGMTSGPSAGAALSVEVQRQGFPLCQGNTPAALYHGCTFIAAPLIWQECLEYYQAPRSRLVVFWQRLTRAWALLITTSPGLLNALAENCRKYLQAVNRGFYQSFQPEAPGCFTRQDSCREPARRLKRPADDGS